MKWFCATAFLALSALGAPSGAADLQSVSRITFGPGNVLFAADWKQGTIHAFELTTPGESAPAPYNILDLSASLSKALETTDVIVEDVVVRPGTGEAYVAVSFGSAKSPAIMVVEPDGGMRRLNVEHLKQTDATLVDAPTSDYKFWGRTPERSLTVTDMKFHDGRLYVAGLSNQAFASTLRIMPYPFHDKGSISSIEMYHTSHNQMETRAPIRALAFAKFEGTDYLIAAYLCTPLVTIPVADLKNGAHVTGKTIAELGYGNLPSDMLTFSTTDQTGKKTDYLFVANVERDGYLLPMSAIRDAIMKPGLDKPVPFGSKAGPDAVDLPMARVLYADNLGDKYMLALRRDVATGHAQLVSYNKDFKFRISDFVSEYDFPDYSYTTDYQKKYIKPVIDTMETEEGYKHP